MTKRQVKRHSHSEAMQTQGEINERKTKQKARREITMGAKYWAVLAVCCGLYGYGAYLLSVFILTWLR